MKYYLVFEKKMKIIIKYIKKKFDKKKFNVLKICLIYD